MLLTCLNFHEKFYKRTTRVSTLIASGSQCSSVNSCSESHTPVMNKAAVELWCHLLINEITRVVEENGFD